MENKKEIVARLKLLLIVTRAGAHIEKMALSDDENKIHITFDSGSSREVNIACDSGIAIIKDVIAVL
ncbi:MAG: hypothetical protein NC416_04410 [Eubacterium sp.]|nr:hypothetical protein [Eubacterium sp.]